MATITLKYDDKNTNVKKLLDSLVSLNLVCIERSEKTSESIYDPKFVKMIKDASTGPKRKLTPALKKKYFGDL